MNLGEAGGHYIIILKNRGESHLNELIGYVGQSRDLQSRMACHFTNLKGECVKLLYTLWRNDRIPLFTRLGTTELDANCY